MKQCAIENPVNFCLHGSQYEGERNGKLVPEGVERT